MVVKELMSTNVCFVKDTACVQDAVSLMRQYDIGLIPICNASGELMGVLTDRDLVMRIPFAQTHRLFQLPVTQIMTRDVFTVSPDLDIHEAALFFAEKKCRRLPVLQGKRLIGILSISDLAKKRVYLAEVADIFGAISTTNRTKNKSWTG